MLVRYKKVGCASNLVGSFSKPSFNKTVRALPFKSVKIIPLKSDNCALGGGWGGGFWGTKTRPLLSCKTYAFETQNNRFCNTLIISLLIYNCSFEKFLHSLW